MLRSLIAATLASLVFLVAQDSQVLIPAHRECQERQVRVARLDVQEPLARQEQGQVALQADRAIQVFQELLGYPEPAVRAARLV